jgi:hypothetical protein
MLVIIFLWLLPPVISVAVAVPAVVLIGLSPRGMSSRSLRFQLYLAGAAVGRVWSLLALVPLVIVLLFGIGGWTLPEDALGAAGYVALGVSFQRWPDLFIKGAFWLRTENVRALLGRPDSLVHARRAFKLLGLYSEFMALVLLLRLVFGFGP